MVASPSTFADVEQFVTMLQAACENASMNDTLRQILSGPNDSRKAILHKLIEHMRENRAPKDFVDAFVCLLDDEVAEKAYQVIYRCSRKVF